MSIFGALASPELCRTGHVARRGTFALKRKGSPALSKARITAGMETLNLDRVLEHTAGAGTRTARSLQKVRAACSAATLPLRPIWDCARMSRPAGRTNPTLPNLP